MAQPVPPCFGALGTLQQQLALFLRLLQGMKIDQESVSDGALLQWFLRAQEGPSTVLTVVCPDYPKERQGDKWVYTFDGLNDGVGLVAGYAADEMVPAFSHLQQLLPALSVVLPMADMEADSTAVLERAGCDFGEFMARIGRSQRALQKYLKQKKVPEGRQKKKVEKKPYGEKKAKGEKPAPETAEQRAAKEAKRLEEEMAHLLRKIHPNATIDTPLLTRERRSQWLACLQEAGKAYAPREDRYPEGMSREMCDKAFVLRAGLYGKWSNGDQNIARRLFDEGVVQYMAVGRFIGLVYPNPLVVGADSALMGQFIAAWGRIPVMYLKPIY